jgi:translation initiation factor IF-2
VAVRRAPRVGAAPGRGRRGAGQHAVFPGRRPGGIAAARRAAAAAAGGGGGPRPRPGAVPGRRFGRAGRDQPGGAGGHRHRQPGPSRPWRHRDAAAGRVARAVHRAAAGRRGGGDPAPGGGQPPGCSPGTTRRCR